MKNCILSLIAVDATKARAGLFPVVPVVPGRFGAGTRCPVSQWRPGTADEAAVPTTLWGGVGAVNGVGVGVGVGDVGGK
jgi:hypothetical protein